MNKTVIMRLLFAVIVLGTIALQTSGPVMAQDAQPLMQSQPQLEQQVPPPVQEVRKRLFLTGAFGFGFASVDIGTTTNGEQVSISGGGGAGLGAGFGAGLTQSLDLDFELGGHVSVLTPATSNAKGSFSRSFLLATLKHKMPTSDTGRFKFGLGLGAYNNGTLDIDARDAGSNHVIVKYKNTLGVHLTGEFERFIGQRTSIQLGGRMYFVKYKAKSLSDNGSAVPIDTLKSGMKELNGNGLDLMIGISQYF